jgi:vacuolar-type H+-ATPase subunit B/Vma2
MPVAENEGLKKAIARLIELSNDKEARAIVEAHRGARREELAQFAAAGRESEAQERREIAQRLLQQGIAVDDGGDGVFPGGNPCAA